MSIRWQWSSFQELKVPELYEALKLRQKVFIVEQNCPYLDADGLDRHAWHLLGWDEMSHQLVACVRVLAPGAKFLESSIGRVVTASEVRGTGIGKQLMEVAIARTRAQFGVSPIRISAQAHLEKFYRNVGFEKVSEPYLEDGIPHIEMLAS